MKAQRIRTGGRDIYRKRSGMNEKAKIAFCSFLVGALVMYVVLHIFM